jgi:tRNA A37 threonylcarbamoyladenosine dehydratase
LLSQVRYRLRKEYGAPKDGKKMHVACIYSQEAVAGPDPSCAVDGDGSLNCHGYGSSVAVTATFGMCAASWILEKLALSPK